MTSLSPTHSNRAIAALLFVGSFAYLFAWPHNLGTSDESHFLYHAKVVLQGGVPYRDFFEFYTPLANYVVALLFGVFGVTIATAKIAMAVLHGAIVALLFVGARTLAVRTSLAIVGSLAYLALGPPAWPFASPHWIATLLLVSIVLVLVLRPLGRGRLVLVGSLSGVLTSMQQQTGVPILAAIVIVISIEAWLDRRFIKSPGDATLARLGYFGAPAIAIPALILLVHMAIVGFQPMFEQLVLHPLTGYREYNISGWGDVRIMSFSFSVYTFPLLLAYLPVVLAPIAGWRLVRAWRAADWFDFKRVSTLTVFSIGTALTVINFPDFIHLAFIVAVFLLFGVETIEWLLRIVPASRWSALWVGGFSILLLAGIGLHLQRNYTRAWETYHLPTDTAFGRVDFATQNQVKVFESVNAALESEPDRMLFCYPVYASLYLTTNAQNPTMHEIMIPGYLNAEEYRATIDILDREQVRYVVMFDWPALGADPMVEYILDKYRCADDSDDCRLYRRID